MGFDPVGRIEICGDQVRRYVQPEFAPECRRTIQTCRSAGIFNKELQPVAIVEIADQRGELILVQERIPFIAYPHEWAPEMYRDAALLQIDLNLKLLDCGLTLKDSHPWNILFDYWKPVWVDTTSVIQRDHFKDEHWLGTFRYSWMESLWSRLPLETKYFYENYRRMFYPYFLFPLWGMASRRFAQVRREVFATTLNASAQTIRPYRLLGIQGIVLMLEECWRALKLLRGADGEKVFLRSLRSDVSRMKIARFKSKYAKYYEMKKEDTDFQPCGQWTQKQKTVYGLLAGRKPSTVLDIACNTGWFAILAARLGNRVVALDIDEECVNILYRTCRREHYAVLPLVMDFVNTSQRVYPTETLAGEETPLLYAAHERLACDIVLALAIVHHFCLGQGKTFDEVVEKLNQFCRQEVLVEFVPLEDCLIQSEKSAFRAYQKHPRSFTWYNQEHFVAKLQKYFRTVRVLPSHPQGRVIIHGTK